MARAKVRRIKRNIRETKNEVAPMRKNRILVIILRENKSTIWKWISFRADRFRVGKNTYFKEPSGVYLTKNKVLCSIYIEGVCVPINHELIERKQELRTYKDKDGNDKTMTVDTISNLKFDSEITDILLNRGLADEFTKTPIAIGSIFMIILLFISIGLNVGVLGMLLN